MNIKEAIILSGGKGTRLKSVVSDLPKPLAPINNIPFLTYILKFLKSQNIEHIVLSVGYKWENIKAIYGDSFEEMKISYAIEETPLGTGGGIALSLEKTISEDILVLNGDSFINFSLNEFYNFHKTKNSTLSFVVKEIRDFNRYGSVELREDKIIRFFEKKYLACGLINTGAYIIKRNAFENLNLPKKFSFEQDFLEKRVNKKIFYGYLTKGFFIDIGVPEDFNKLNEIIRDKAIEIGNNDIDISILT